MIMDIYRVLLLKLELGDDLDEYEKKLLIRLESHLSPEQKLCNRRNIKDGIIER